MNTNPAPPQESSKLTQHQSEQVQAALKNATDIVCDECENKHFVPVFVVKKISALVSPNGQDVIIPLQVLKCDQCSHINQQFLNSDFS